MCVCVCVCVCVQLFLIFYYFYLHTHEKLRDVPVTLEDLAELNPTLFSSMKSILDYQGDDFSEVFDLNFVVTYEGLLRECSSKKDCVLRIYLFILFVCFCSSVW